MSIPNDDRLFCRGVAHHDSQLHPCNFCKRMEMPGFSWDVTVPVQVWFIDRPLDEDGKCGYIKLERVG